MRYMTLIELLIALLLGSFLFTGLLSFYFLVNQIDEKQTKESEFTTSWQYTHQRLLNIMSKISCNTALNQRGFPNEKSSFFYTCEPTDTSYNNSLVFTHKSRSSSTTKLSPTILSKLFINEQNQLILLTWSLPKKGTKEEDFYPGDAIKEVLMENIYKFEMIFYSHNLEKTEENLWAQHSWPFTKKSVPEFIKFSLYLDETMENLPSIEFACPLPRSGSFEVTIKKGS